MLEDTYERDVVEDGLADWLRVWTGQGWLAVGDPVVVGRGPTGAAVLRVRLERTPAARFAPGFPPPTEVRHPREPDP